jgi:4'-phosphopantetheinyl transferase EntD
MCVPLTGRYARGIVLIAASESQWTPMLDEVLPGQVASREYFGDIPDVVLFPAEQAAIERAIESRRREFATGRACARAALADLGMPPAPVLRGADGGPVWPTGIVGSITHCTGYRAAAAARAEDFAAIGIDAEPAEPLPPDVMDVVTLATERARLAALPAGRLTAPFDRVLFSAKESLYKAWYPVTHRWLGFEDADVTIDAENGSFRAKLLVPGPSLGGRPLTQVSGRWLVRDGLIVTAVALAQAPG